MRFILHAPFLHRRTVLGTVLNNKIVGYRGLTGIRLWEPVFGFLCLAYPNAMDDGNLMGSFLTFSENFRTCLFFPHFPRVPIQIL